MIRSNWAIACVLSDRPNLYYSSVQWEPEGSITLSRHTDTDPLSRPMYFFTERGAESVLGLIVNGRALARLFKWKVVLLEGV